MESCQNHFWYALIASPFPPLSPQIQCLSGGDDDGEEVVVVPVDDDCDEEDTNDKD